MVLKSIQKSNFQIRFKTLTIAFYNLIRNEDLAKLAVVSQFINLFNNARFKFKFVMQLISFSIPQNCLIYYAILIKCETS